MRLRNNPKAYEIMEENADLVILKPEEHKGHYHDIFEINQPLYIEIGMGKGDFIYQNALKHPENNYIGIEKFPSVLAAAINKINKNQSECQIKARSNHRGQNGQNTSCQCSPFMGQTA